jgi:hypothetical protein
MGLRLGVRVGAKVFVRVGEGVGVGVGSTWVGVLVEVGFDSVLNI